MKSARVIGAGLSGLSAAWLLADAGFDVEVLDAAAQPGGLIETAHTAEGLVERAANAFVWSESVERWFKTLAITPCFALPSSRKRYIFRDGRPRRWPLTIIETATTAARVGMTWTTRRLAAEDRETVATWANRAFGRAAAMWLVSPALQGVYAAPSDRLCARAVFGGRRGRVVSAAPSGGMGEFIGTLHDRLRARGVVVSFGARVDAIDPATPTVIATDARTAAVLLAAHAPALAAAIGSVAMSSMVTATAFFEPRRDDLHGFGVLFPRSSGVSALGALFNADIFDGRSALRSETWIYGSADSADRLPGDADISGQLVRDRQKLTGRADAPVAVYAVRRAPALPIYDAAILDVRDRLPDLPPRIALAGNYLGRLGVGKLLDVAAEAAARLAGSGARATV